MQPTHRSRALWTWSYPLYNCHDPVEARLRIAGTEDWTACSLDRKRPFFRLDPIVTVQCAHSETGLRSGLGSGLFNWLTRGWSGRHFVVSKIISIEVLP